MTTVSQTTSDAATAAALLNKTSTSTAASSASANATTAKEASERFLKLLVTQLKNQDPLNPVDNAQMTSQMAQISTVSGIEKLNTTVQSLNGQFVQMQALQGASLVGKEVILKGDKIAVNSSANGNVASGTFELPAAADHVKAEVLSPAGLVVDTLTLGAQTAGRHDFVWPNGSTVSESAGYRFRITATSGTTAVASTPLMRDTVQAINTGGASLTLELARSGAVPYTSITALN